MEYEAVGAPILCAVCYCTDCQDAGERHEATPGAVCVREPDGGTAYATYRDDRFRCLAGADLLQPQRLSAKAPTRRMISRCCNTPIYLKFEKGFWISAYRARIVGAPPALEWRNKVARRRSKLTLPQDLPVYQGYAPALITRLLAAGLAMLFTRDRNA